MNKELARIREIRMGGAVERCHTVRHIGSYSNAAHSWGVAVLLYVLWPEDFHRLAPYCIFHDVPEGWVGDVPAHIKKINPIKFNFAELESKVLDRLNLPDDSKLGEDDRRKLKACDNLELYFWTQEQLAMGNTYVLAVQRTLERFLANSPLPDRALALFRSMCAVDHTVSYVRSV